MARSSAGLSPDAQPDGHLINERVSLAWPAPWAACILHFNLFTCLVPLLVLGHPKSVITGALTAVKRQRALACALDAREIDRQQLLSRVRKKSFHSFSCAVSSQRERESGSEFLCERRSASFVYTDSVLPTPASATAPGCRRTHVAHGPHQPVLSRVTRERNCVLCESVLCVCVCESKCACVRVLSAKCQRVLWHFFATL